MEQFASYMPVGDLHDGILAEINSRAEAAGTRWRAANFGFVYYDPSETDSSGDDYFSLELKVHNKVPIRTGRRVMGVVMQNEPESTRNGIDIDFEMDDAAVVMIRMGEGMEPVFRVDQLSNLKGIIEKAAQWLADHSEQDS